MVKRPAQTLFHRLSSDSPTTKTEHLTGIRDLDPCVDVDAAADVTGHVRSMIDRSRVMTFTSRSST